MPLAGCSQAAVQQPWVQADGQVSELRVGATQLFWLDSGGLERVSKTGGARVLVAPATDDAGLAVYGDSIYWARGSTIFTADASGRAPTMIPTGGTPGAIAVDATAIYWVDAQTGALTSIPKAGGTPTILTQSGVAPSRLASDGVDVYYTTSNSTEFSVAMKPTTGGPATTLETLPNDYSPVQVDGLVAVLKNVVWLEYFPESAKSAVHAWSASRGDHTLPFQSYNTLAADAERVYVQSFSTGITSFRWDGTESLTTETPLEPDLIGVDASTIYFAASTDWDTLKNPAVSGIYRVSKPQ